MIFKPIFGKKKIFKTSLFKNQIGKIDELFDENDSDNVNKQIFKVKFYKYKKMNNFSKNKLHKINELRNKNQFNKVEKKILSFFFFLFFSFFF